MGWPPWRQVSGRWNGSAGDTVPDSADYSISHDFVEIEPPRHLLLHSTRHVLPPIRSSDFSCVFVLLPTP
jgi:hypothetical protein